MASYCYYFLRNIVYKLQLFNDDIPVFLICNHINEKQITNVTDLLDDSTTYPIFYCNKKLHVLLLLKLRFVTLIAQTNTNKPVARDVGRMTIGVKCYAAKIRTICRCTKIRRDSIIAPISTTLSVRPLVTRTRVPGNKEAGVERIIADQQLIGISVVDCSHTFPQSIGTSDIPIVISGRYGLVHMSFEVGLVSSLVINEDNFCKL